MRSVQCLYDLFAQVAAGAMRLSVANDIGVVEVVVIVVVVKMT